jgi:hypothetical protein
MRSVRAGLVGVLATLALAVALVPAAGAATGRHANPAARARIAVGPAEGVKVRKLGQANLRRLARTQSPKTRLRFTPAQKQFAEREEMRAGAADEGPSAKAALQPPSVAGFPVAVSPARRGFEGLSHRDQAFASGLELEPPDQGLCGGTVGGTTFLFESVNIALALYDSNTTQYTPPVDLNSFFGQAPVYDPATDRFGPFLSDPKCYFDPDTHRWFHTVLEIDVDPVTGEFADRAATLVAVSASRDPLGDYYLYAIDATDRGHPHCPCFGDQPLLGADANGLYVTTSEYSIAENFANGSQLYALDKRALANGNPRVPVHIATGTTRTASVQPATAPSGQYETAQRGTEYFMSGFDCLPPDCRINPGLGNQITVWALTHTKSLRTDNPRVRLSARTIDSEVYGQPVPQVQRPGFRPLGEALGEPLPLVEPNDTRMNQVVYAHGHLWSAINTVVTPGPRDGIAWFRVRPTVATAQIDATIAQQGYVAARNAFLSFPSVGVNDAGRGVIAYSLMGPGYYPSAAWTPISTQGTTSTVRVAQPGFRPEDGFTCYDFDLCRWGDYSASFALPGGEVWSAAEFIPAGARTTYANWGTFIWPVVR